MSYNVFDFGVRRKQLDFAKADDKEKLILLIKDTRDLKIDAVDVYGSTLELYKQSKIYNEKLRLQKELVDINKRLNANGFIAQSECIQKQIELLDKKLRLEQHQIKNFLTQYKIYILTTAGTGL